MNVLKTCALAVLATALFSCEKIKELASVEVETEVSLSVDLGTVDKINLLGAVEKGANLDGSTPENAVYFFEGIVELNLSENDDINQYLDGILSFNVTDGKYCISGYSGTDTISSLFMEYSFDRSDFDKITNETKTVKPGTPLLNTVNGNAHNKQVKEISEVFNAQTLELEGLQNQLVHFSNTGAINHMNEGPINLENYRSHYDAMQNMSKRITTLLDDARKNGDILSHNCLNEKLPQLNAFIRLYSGRTRALAEALAKEDKNRATYETTLLSILQQNVERINRESLSCLANTANFIGEQITELGKTTPPVTPNEINVIAPPVGPLLEPTPSPKKKASDACSAAGGSGSFDKKQVQTLMDELKNKGFATVYLKVSGSANFDVDAKSTQINISYPSKVKYSPL